MSEEKLIQEIDYLGSTDEYLAFMHEHFGLEPEEIMEVLEAEELEKREFPAWEEVLTADGMGGIWEEDLAKKKRPQDYPKGWFVLTHHGRGSSVSDLTPIIVKRANGEVEVIPIYLLFPRHSKTDQVEITDGTKVWGKNGWESIKWIMRHTIAEHLLRINTYGSSIDVTFDHSLFQQNKAVESKNLRTGNKIDQIELPLIEGKDDVDKEFAWMLGFWVAEGSYKRGINAEFSNNDFELLRRIDIWAKKYGFGTCIYKSGKGYKLELFGLRIFEQFIFQGPHNFKTRKARLKEIPPFIFKWNKESKMAFFDGYLAGDGERIGQIGISFATVSQTLAQGLILIAKIIYPDRIPSIDLQENTFRIRLVHRKSRSGRLANAVYPFRNEIKKILESKSVNFAGSENPNFKDGHYSGTKFIEKQYWIYRHKRYVYDVETESHSFQAGIGNILAHNSVHKDLRVKANDHLSPGWTIADQIEGAITEKIKTVSDLRKWKWNNPKLFKFQPNMGDQNVKAVTVKKSDQPLAWLNIKNVAFPPGSVGASRYEPGVFLAVDEGMAYQGVQKSYFKEWWLDGKHFKGRLVFRLIAVRPGWEKKPKGKLQWQCWMVSTTPKGQLPYLLSPRGRSRKDVAPPEGESWLPPEWEAKIKTEFRWWPDSKSKQEKIKLIDQAFNDLIEQGRIKARKLKLSEELQTDTAVILMTYGELKAKGWEDEKIIEQIAKNLLPIGGTLDYWKKKVREVLQSHGLLKSSIKKRGFEDFEYLLHHIHIGEKGKEEIHHCLICDHIANMFEQAHLLVKNGKVYVDGKLVKEEIFHIIKGLEPTQEVTWSDEEARENKIKPKAMKAGMKLREKAKEW